MRNVSSTLFESVPQRMKAILKGEGGSNHYSESTANTVAYE